LPRGEDDHPPCGAVAAIGGEVDEVIGDLIVGDDLEGVADRPARSRLRVVVEVNEQPDQRPCGVGFGPRH
jgi:hypothetical protein